MVRIRPSALLLLLLVLLLPEAASAAGETRLIVKRAPGLDASERRDVRADAGVELVETLSLPRTEVVTTDDPSAALAQLDRDPDVAYAEVDRPVSALATDPGFSLLWGLDKIFAGDAGAAWALSTGAGRTVAVVDSGVDAAHPDLTGRVAVGNDWVDGDDDPQDTNGHGTHVAGTIAAVRGNGKGIAGVAPDARVVPLRVLADDGQGSTSHVIEAFDWAGERDIRVVNASLGGKGFLRAEYDVIAGHPSTLFVVAAGNDGEDNDNPATAVYPCAYGVDNPGAPALDNVLCVGASDQDDLRAYFSNYGEDSVDLFAPGVDILSTELGAYYWNDGTSMATPHVAAAAALLAARSPGLSAVEIKQAILASAAPIAAERHRVDASAALMATPADTDGDGISDAGDNCPSVPNPGQEDTDDSVPGGDACAEGAPPVDRDGDGVEDALDACPDEKWGGVDGCPLAAVTAPDRDHDGVADTADPCPDVTEPGGFGCPDEDGDLVPDDDDNCPTVPNPSQADADRDGIGDACDPDRDGDGRSNGTDRCPDEYGAGPDGCVPAPQPPPTTPGPITQNPPPAPPPSAPNPDRDGDGRVDASDGCPTEAAATADGCPVARVRSLSAKVKRRTVTIRVRADRAATARVTVQRKRCKRGRRCRWVRVARRTVASDSGRVKVRVKRLRKGSHRVVVRLSSNAGRGQKATRRFRVR